MSTSGPGSEPDNREELGDNDRCTGLIRNKKSRRKFVPQVRYRMPKRTAVCNLETVMN